ncbi:MAG: TetR/AcrR family transcriptional regulator [Desulfobacterales bacterium]|nr:TetR/AcrR family transcriptional regulator [Desulfobacterales bacterium]
MAKIERKSIAEIRKEEIILAFINVVAEKGFSKATTREIAKAADCSLGMLHHYFKNKDQMIRESMDYTIAAYKIDFDKMISDYDTAEDQLKAFINSLIELDAFNIAWAKIFHEFRASTKIDPENIIVILKYHDQDKAFIGNIIKRGIESGEFKDNIQESTIDMILGSAYGILSLWFIDQNTVSLKEMGKQHSEMVINFLRR